MDEMMHHTPRRTFLKRAAAVAGALSAPTVARAAEILVRKPNPNDVRIDRVSHAFEELVYRTPLKFARAVVDRQTMLTVTCTVRTAAALPRRWKRV